MGQVSTRRPSRKHRHPVGKREHFIQAMADVQDGNTLGPQPAQQMEQRFGFARGQRGRRLVQDQHAALPAKRPRDADHLPQCDGQFTHRAGQGNRVSLAHARQQRAGLAPHSGPVQQQAAGAARFAPHKQIVLGPRLGNATASWWITAMPAASDAATSPGEIGVPFSRTLPASDRIAPAKILISVDLPAPFSPTSA
jgi:hypothetical protein